MIDESLRSDIYCTIIDHVMLPYVLEVSFRDGDILFQHVISPVHMPRKVWCFLEDRCFAELHWLSKGPRLNIIEHGQWRRIKIVMARHLLQRTTADELWDAVQDEWEMLRGQRDFVVALCGSPAITDKSCGPRARVRRLPLQLTGFVREEAPSPY